MGTLAEERGLGKEWRGGFSKCQPHPYLFKGLMSPSKRENSLSFLPNYVEAKGILSFKKLSWFQVYSVSSYNI